MLIEAPLGNLGPDIDPDTADRAIDWLDLTWTECLQRALRRTTRGGVHVKIVARLGVRLRHGDVLRQPPADGAPKIAINVVPCDVLVARPLNAQATASLCYEMGSLHLPVQICDGQIISPADGPVEALLDRLDIPYRAATQRFEPSSTPLMPITLAPGFRIRPVGSA